MKNITRFDQFGKVNENSDITVSVGEGWEEEIMSTEEQESSAAKGFKWTPEPVTVTKLTADLKDPYNSLVYIEFSNNDKLLYEMKETRTKPSHWGAGAAPPYYNQTLTINDKSFNAQDIETIGENYFGNTKAFVGDLLQLYKDFKDGKLK